MTNTSQLLKIPDVIRKTGASDHYVRAWIASGDLPAAQFVKGGTWLIRSDDLDAFIAAHWGKRDHLPGGVAEFERTDREQSPSEAREVTDGDCSEPARSEERSAANPKGEQS